MSYIDTLIEDMAWFHDGPSAVLSVLFPWGSGMMWPESTSRPSSDWLYSQMWTHTSADTNHANGNGFPWRDPGPYTGNQAPNTRVQQADLQMWWLLSNGVWVLGTHNPTPGDSLFEYNWSESTIVPGSWRDEGANGGGASILHLGYGSNNRLWHAWASPHLIPNNAVATVACMYSRLILDNPNGPDDRHLARILTGCAGDWYKNAYQYGVPWVVGPGGNITYMGYNRMRYVTNDWQLFSWYSNDRTSEATIRANPPPLIGLDRLNQQPGPDPEPFVPLVLPSRGNWFPKLTSGMNTWTTHGVANTPASKIRRRRGTKLWS